MKKVVGSLLVLGIAVSLLISKFGYCGRGCMREPFLVQDIVSVDQVKALFQISAADIPVRVDRAIAQAQEAIDAIIALELAARTFANTAGALDEISGRSQLAIIGHVLSYLEILSPDKSIRDAAHEAVQKMEQFFVEQLGTNKKLYEAFKAYAEGNALHEKLTDEQRYFITESMNDFKRAGLEKDEHELAKIKEIKKEIARLGQEFDRNCAADHSLINVAKEGLAGLDDDFIAQLPRDGERYVLGVDYPTFFNVMDNCTVAETRKQLYIAFSNRAYPANRQILIDLIAKRDELARMLDFASYAAADLDDQMVKTVGRAQQFIDDMVVIARDKENKEYDAWLAQVGDRVTRDADGKLQPWDISFIKSEYKKKRFNLDERETAAYFPMESTIDAMLDIYRQFFSIQFVKHENGGFWHDDVQLLEIQNVSGKRLGYLLMDLYPRQDKFSHAACAKVFPALKDSAGNRTTYVGILMANFPKSTSQKPSLLMLSDVTTFFHEFGHALHGVLGATQLSSFSGTQVKRDFVEMPSQMLEEWFHDRAMLKKVSKHYQTGEPLPDDRIDAILEVRTFDSGYFLMRQLFFAQVALDLFGPGETKDPYALWHTLRTRWSSRVAPYTDVHPYANFGHLVGYGAKYYGYMWSKVFALDLFDEIKNHGLLNPEIGKRYVDAVIGRGGSADPNDLLKDFLGREPNNKAFLRDMGFVEG